MILPAKWRWKIAQAAEIRWWRWYLSDKEKVAYLERKCAYWRTALDASGLKFNKGSKVLDAGCGPAGIFMILWEQKVFALDPLLDSYRQALPHFDPDSYPWVEFHNIALEDLPSELQFNWIVCLNAINHVADMELCFDKLAGALSPGGKILLGVDSHRHGPLKRVFRLLPGDILHPHQHGLQDYMEQLERRGLKVERSICMKSGTIFNYDLIVASRKES